MRGWPNRPRTASSHGAIVRWRSSGELSSFKKTYWSTRAFRLARWNAGRFATAPAVFTFAHYPARNVFLSRAFFRWCPSMCPNTRWKPRGPRIVQPGPRSICIFPIALGTPRPSASCRPGTGGRSEFLALWLGVHDAIRHWSRGRAMAVSGRTLSGRGLSGRIRCLPCASGRHAGLVCNPLASDVRQTLLLLVRAAACGA